MPSDNDKVLESFDGAEEVSASSTEDIFDDVDSIDSVDELDEQRANSIKTIRGKDYVAELKSRVNETIGFISNTVRDQKVDEEYHTVMRGGASGDYAAMHEDDPYLNRTKKGFWGAVLTKDKEPIPPDINAANRLLGYIDDFIQEYGYERGYDVGYAIVNESLAALSKTGRLEAFYKDLYALLLDYEYADGQEFSDVIEFAYELSDMLYAGMQSFWNYYDKPREKEEREEQRAAEKVKRDEKKAKAKAKEKRKKEGRRQRLRNKKALKRKVNRTIKKGITNAINTVDNAGSNIKLDTYGVKYNSQLSKDLHNAAEIKNDIKGMVESLDFSSITESYGTMSVSDFVRLINEDKRLRDSLADILKGGE